MFVIGIALLLLLLLVDHGSPSVQLVLVNPTDEVVVVSVDMPEGIQTVSVPKRAEANVNVLVGTVILRGKQMPRPIHLVTRADEGRKLEIAP